MSARIAEEAALSSSYFHTNDESSDSDDEGHGLDDEGHGLDDEGHGLDDEGPGLEEEETAPEVSSPIALPATTPAATISVDEDQFLENSTSILVRPLTYLFPTNVELEKYSSFHDGPLRWKNAELGKTLWNHEET
nr:hypothetical protein [Tanacetum cinerariifolium]